MEGKHRGVGMERLTAFPEHYELRQLVQIRDHGDNFRQPNGVPTLPAPDMPIYRSQVPRIFYA